MNISRLSSASERMNRKLLFGQALLMLMLSLGTSSQATEGLKCHSDFIDVITCEWDRSSAENRSLITPTTKCLLLAEYDGSTATCDLVPYGSAQKKLSKATLKFEEEALLYGAPTLPLKVLCENMAEPVEEIKDFNPAVWIKLYPPERPAVSGENVTWNLGSPVPIFMREFMFEVQWRQRKSSWKSENVAQVQEKFYRLDKSTLILGEEYAIRVRSACRNSRRTWSEWSNVIEWTSTVGQPPSTPEPEVLSQMFLDSFNGLTSVYIVTATVVFALAFFSIHHFRRSWSLKSILKPKPSEYFNHLFSDGGDFKSPTAIPELYLKPESEDVTPVEVETFHAFYPSPGKTEKGDNQRDNSNSMTSFFSNSTYFLSQSSKCAVSDQLQPCTTDCPYGPAGGTGENEKCALVGSENNSAAERSASSSVETSPSCDDLHKLRIDVQSPDSGFAAGNDDQESQDESGSEGLPSPPVVDDVLPMNCILQCPVPQLSGFPNPHLPPNFLWSPWNSLAFPILPSGISSTLPFGNSKFQSCPGMVEPSDDDYMPVKKVQE